MDAASDEARERGVVWVEAWAGIGLALHLICAAIVGVGHVPGWPDAWPVASAVWFYLALAYPWWVNAARQRLWPLEAVRLMARRRDPVAVAVDEVWGLLLAAGVVVGVGWVFGWPWVAWGGGALLGPLAVGCAVRAAFFVRHRRRIGR